MMDRPQVVSQTLDSGLKNLALLNRRFGGYRSLRWFFRSRLVPGEACRILDLATGGGDNLRMLADHCRKARVKANFEGVDFRDATLELARRWSEGYPEIRFVEADIREFAPEADFDFVICTTALHHFSDEDAVVVLRRAGALARRAVLVVDLERGWLWSLCVRLATAAFCRDEMTREDGRVSMERAFSRRELGELARRAGWEHFSQRRILPARQAIWMEQSPIRD